MSGYDPTEKKPGSESLDFDTGMGMATQLSKSGFGGFGRIRIRILIKVGPRVRTRFFFKQMGRFITLSCVSLRVAGSKLQIITVQSLLPVAEQQ